MKKRSKTLRKVGIILAGLGAALSSNAMAEMRILTDGGLTVYDPKNPCYWFSLGSRIELDEIIVSGKTRDRSGIYAVNNYNTTGNIRRAFVGLRGGVGDEWTYDLSLNFARIANTVFIEEAWGAYNWDCARLRFGQFTPLATLDGYGSYGIHNGQMFLEPALATRAFGTQPRNIFPGVNSVATEALKGFGIMLEAQFCDMFTFAATVYQPPQGIFNYGSGFFTPVVNNTDFHRSDRVGEAVRLTFSPVHEDCYAWHFGLLGRHQETFHTARDGVTPITNDFFFTTPEVFPRDSEQAIATLVGRSPIGSPFLVDVGPLRARSYSVFAAEAATIWGPVTLAAEYHHAVVQRRSANNLVDRGNLNFQGWHVEGGYVLTGESRGYDFGSGTLLGIRPCSPCGAWEIVARYSYVSLQNKNIFGGFEHNATVGLNWYVNSNVRFAVNYIRASIRETGNPPGTQVPATTPKRGLDFLGARLSITF